MLGSLISWFKALSVAGKTGVIATTVITGSVGASAMSSSPPEPVVTNKPECTSSISSDTETETIKFETEEVKDSNLNKGKTEVRTKGVNGEKEFTYDTTSYDPEGCEEDKTELVKEEVSKEPINEVLAVGTYVAPEPEPEQASSSNCNPNYSGCVPNAYDVDCAGGSGNGPAYTGRVSVIGSDVYGLDADGDGIGCE